MTDPEYEAAPAASAAQPLCGVLVADLSRYLPGPLVGRLLGDLGARVVKVEEPAMGDPSRQAPPIAAGVSSLASLLLAGHQSIALDLKKDAAREVAEALLERADVLVESFRPGTLARFGLDPTSLRRRFPKLVICSVTGWGQDGPHAARAGHDLGYQAIAGALASRPEMPGVQVADIVGGWSGATAVLAALHRRDRDGFRVGDGCWIDQSLLDAAGHANLTSWAAEVGGPQPAGTPLMLTGALPCYRLYRTRDGGKLALAALEPKFWRRFCGVVERRDWIPKQLSDDPAVHAEIAELVAARDRATWAVLFDEHDIPGEPVLSVAESRRHPQVVARGLVHDAEDGTLRLGYPACFDGERPRAEGTMPALGADTAAVLDELGCEEQSRRRGVGAKRSLKRWLTTRAVAWWDRRRGKRDD